MGSFSIMWIVLLLLISYAMTNYVELVELEDYSVTTSFTRNYDSFMQPVFSLIILVTGAFLLREQSVFLFVVGMLLLVMSIYDIKYRLAPDFINVFILIVGVARVLVEKKQITYMAEPLFNAIIVVGILVILSSISENTKIGGGDQKLMGSLAFVLSTDPYFLNIILYPMIMTVFMVPYCLIKGYSLVKTSMPAVPFITIAFYITVLYGSDILMWYRGG